MENLFANFDENTIEEKNSGSSFLNTAGLHLNGELVSIEYKSEISKSSNKPYEAAVIKVRSEDGEERELSLFIPTKDSIFPRDMWIDGKNTGVKEEFEVAKKRTLNDFNQKLLAPIASQLPIEKVKAQTQNCKSYKDMITIIGKLLKAVQDNKMSKSVNFILLFANNTNKQSSNLLIPELNCINGKTVWMEATEFNEDGTIKPAGISIAKKVLTGKDKYWSLEEKYPYNKTSSDNTMGGSSTDSTSKTEEDDDLPF